MHVGQLVEAWRPSAHKVDRVQAVRSHPESGVTEVQVGYSTLWYQPFPMYPLNNGYGYKEFRNVCSCGGQFPTCNPDRPNVRK